MAEYEKELACAMMRRGFTRREIIKYGLGLGLSASGLSVLLTACGQARQAQTDAGQQAAAGSTPALASVEASAGSSAAPAAEAPVASGEVQFSEQEGAAGPWPQSAVAEPTSPVEISVAHAWDAAFWPRQQQFDKLFTERHPNITIKAENTPWGDFLQKYLAQIAGGAAPDLFYVHFSWAQQMIKQGSVIELDNYVAQQTDFNIDDFTKPSLLSYRRDGKLYGVPYDEGPGILYYNKDIFDKAGVAYPDDTWTLDTLKETAKKLTTGEGPNKIFGFGGTPSPGDTLMAPAYLFPFGAQYITEPNEDTCVINSPEGVQAMEWWMELRTAGAVPSPADVETARIQGDLFQFGRVAMKIDGSWATPGINQNAKFAWDVAKWPAGPEKQSTFSAGSCYMIAKASKNPDAAWIYLNDYISTAGQIYMWGSTGRGSPARNSAWDSYLKSEFAPANAQIILDSLDTFASHDILDQPTAPKVNQAATPIWDLVVNGQLGVKEALDQICAALEPILAENKA